MENMTPNRPYLLRAFYDWILDNEHTPYLVVEADLPHVQVPPQSVKDGQVVLNISPSAVQSLQISNEQLTFSARFGGVPFEVYVPMYAVSAIYARENGAGTMFPPEDYDIDGYELAPVEGDTSEVEEPGASFEVVSSSEKDSKKVDSTDKKRSHLSIVK
ncbi:ClpXP protease specificity-enhancing factor [Psychrosphaera aestuarii]|uniref:ClpXP protease specificity-enhancing factor n=1 Tax=Psychrosphaera aestuarii TaxID=1266052 RepID=UPI001B3245DB|nr:ClpXP protease specificity-enhancing factor [Psychrosphaera aestuarii]